GNQLFAGTAFTVEQYRSIYWSHFLYLVGQALHAGIQPNDGTIIEAAMDFQLPIIQRLSRYGKGLFQAFCRPGEIEEIAAVMADQLKSIRASQPCRCQHRDPLNLRGSGQHGSKLLFHGRRSVRVQNQEPYTDLMTKNQFFQILASLG